jgi:hypothetical protein
MVAEAVDRATERRPRSQAHQRVEASRGADIAWREDVHTPEASQQHQSGAPGTDARQLRQRPQRVTGIHP